MADLNCKPPINNKLRDIREERHLSQCEISEATGINLKTLSRYERGERTPDITTVLRLAKYYEIATDKLFSLQEG